MDLPAKKRKQPPKITQKLLDKLEKKSILEKQKHLKPGECMKYMKVILDPMLLNGNHGNLILNQLLENNLKSEVRSQIVPGIISFERTVNQSLIGTELRLTNKIEEQEQILYFMMGEELVTLIKTGKVVTTLKEVKENLPGKFVTLIIYGLKEFCRNFKDIVGRKQIERSLTEVQLYTGCSNRLLETAADLAFTICQFSKSVAEEPFKKQQNEKYEQENFYLMGDNKDCVKIQGMNGLARLWQQQLQKIPLVSLEISQSIANVYPMPKTLFDAYKNNPLDGPSLLAEVPVRRRAGPLTSVRKIGLEMSKKVYTLFNSLNENEFV